MGLSQFFKYKLGKIFKTYEQAREMGPEGPRSRMGDWLVGALSLDINNTLDYLLMEGYLTAEERMQMASGIQGSINVFLENIPEEVRRRRMDYWNADPTDFLDSDPQEFGVRMRERYMDSWENTLAIEVSKGAVPFHDEGTTDPETAWSAPTLSDFTDESFDNLSAEERRRIAAHYAWTANSPPETFGDLKLPHHRPGKSGVGPAVWRGVAAAMGALMGARGGVDIPADDKQAVYNHLARHYKQYEKEPPEFKSRYMFLRTKDGDLWFFGMYSNKYIDETGEIIPEAAHEEYAEWLNKSGFKPAIILNHNPRMSGDFWVKALARYENKPDVLNTLVDKVFNETMIARAERVVVWHGFTFVVGKVLPDRVKLAEKAIAAGDGRMSHGFVAYYSDDFNKDDSSANIIGKYRSFEMSLLVGKQPANKITQAALLGEKMIKLSEDDKKFLSEFFTDDEINEMEATLGNGETVLDMVLSHKEAEEQEVVEAAPAPVEEPVSNAAPEVFQELVKALNLDQLQTLLHSMNEQLTQLNGKVRELEGTVADLKRSDDDKIAETLLPSYNWLGGFSAAQDDKTVVGESELEAAKKAGPQGDPMPNPDNPLVFGFYNWLNK